MLSKQRLSDVIGTIYDCAIEPTLWPTELEVVRDRLSYLNATVSAFDLPSGSQFLGVNVGIAPEWEAAMADYGPDIVTMRGGLERLARFPLEEPIILSQVAGDGLYQNRYFQEWKLSQGSTDTVMIGLVRDSSMMAAIGLGRHSAQGVTDEENLSALRLLAPHFRRAVSIGRLLDLRRLHTATFAAILDALPSAILLVDAEARIVHCQPGGG